MKIKLLILTVLLATVACSKHEIGIGVCASVGSAAEIDPDSTGCSYVEVSVTGSLIPEQSDSTFAVILQQIKELKVPVLSANGFFPGSIKLVGPDVDTIRIRNYVSVAMKRAKQVGIKTIVLGSGESRRIPDGFDSGVARRQFVVVCRMIAEVAAEYGVVVVLEPLNPKETNIINTTMEGADIVREIGMPSFKLLADFFHMARAGEDPYANILAISDCLYHCHIAENENRTAPGVEGDDFTLYFKALKDISYSGDISIECGGMQDMGKSLKSAVDYINLFK